MRVFVDLVSVPTPNARATSIMSYAVQIEGVEDPEKVLRRIAKAANAKRPDEKPLVNWHELFANATKVFFNTGSNVMVRWPGAMEHHITLNAWENPC